MKMQSHAEVDATARLVVRDMVPSRLISTLDKSKKVLSRSTESASRDGLAELGRATREKKVGLRAAAQFSLYCYASASSAPETRLDSTLTRSLQKLVLDCVSRTSPSHPLHVCGSAAIERAVPRVFSYIRIHALSVLREQVVTGWMSRGKRSWHNGRAGRCLLSLECATIHPVYRLKQRAHPMPRTWMSIMQLRF